jgi:NAD(P)-dependent dehydrogenase (short-subunit alcohol dehydrogenase family)
MRDEEFGASASPDAGRPHSFPADAVIMTGVSRVLITGSADGLGLMAARELIAAGHGHEVFLHARSEERAAEAMEAAPGAAGALAGDLSSIDEIRELAAAADRDGPFDTVIHNAGVGFQERRTATVDGLEHVFVINVLAPYLLTALMDRPQRLVYLSSGMHRGGDPDLADLEWERRRWRPAQAYSDSKLLDTALAFAVADRWPEVRANAVDPGWVATKMGGPGAPDDLELGVRTQAWLAVSEDGDAQVTGELLHHQRPIQAHPLARDPGFRQRLLEACAEVSGVVLAL